MRTLDDLIEIIGPTEAGVISIDEKATVPLGLPAVSRTTHQVCVSSISLSF